MFRALVMLEIVCSGRSNLKLTCSSDICGTAFSNMDTISEISRLGFDRVIVLNGHEPETGYERLVLCFRFYKAARENAEIPDAVIHPYYPVSQEAYIGMRDLIRNLQKSGVRAENGSRVRLKPILRRIPFMKYGINTLSYFPDQGSRFHVQVLLTDEKLPITCTLQMEEQVPQCHNCERCLRECPTHAIRRDGFEKEKCIRFWMLNGKLPPEKIYRNNGNRLLGCDVCESVCPMNLQKDEQDNLVISLREILTRQAFSEIGEMIGMNYAIPNRLLIQACVIAGCMKRIDLAGEIEQLVQESSSENVRLAAENALRMMRETTDERNTQFRP